MPGNDGDGWDDWDENADTKADKTQRAIPEKVPTGSTNRHPTLQGYVDREIEISRARLDERQFLLMAFVLWQMERGAHPDVANQLMTRFDLWLADPEHVRLVRVALDRPDGA